jgi:hypothetical protein
MLRVNFIVTTLIASVFCTSLIPETAYGYHKTNKHEQKQRVTNRCARTAWGEIGGEQYAKFTIAVAAAVATYGAASSAVFGVIAEELGTIAYDLAQQLGREVAAKVLSELIQHGGTKVFNGVEAGYQAWNRAECLDTPFGTQCMPLPNTHAFYVAWDCNGGGSSSSVDTRNVWRYSNGYIKREGNLWVEYQNGVRGPTFRELGRTASYVELYDSSRNLTLRLTSSRMEWKQGANDSWKSYWSGSWN